MLARLIPEAPFRLLGIGLSDLTPAPEPAAALLAEATTDAIRAHFGAAAIMRGRALR